MGKRKKQTALILRKARLGKGFTQQYVAVNANTNVRAYQRLESGERDILSSPQKRSSSPDK